MLRLRQHLLYAALLHDLSVPHHRDTVRNLAYHRKIVRDEEHREPVLDAQLLQ
jgi:hypothetical protein